MATGGQKEVPSNLVTVGNLTLENTDDLPSYISIVICQDKIVVIDYNVRKVRINQLIDGKFLATSHRLESEPRDLCLMNTMEICVIHVDGLIKVMSIDFTDMSRVFTTTRSLRLQGVLDEYHGVVRFKDSLVVSGVKQGTIYWCIVSFDDGHVDTIHQICQRSIGLSSVTTKDNIIYISCNAGHKSPDTGVYGFDILHPSQCKYTYKHQRLRFPKSIVINEGGNIYVCNGFPDCIHQLTASCQLVAIFTQEIPWCLRAIFWDHGRLYVTCSGTVDITIFQPVYQAGHTEFPGSHDRKHLVTAVTSTWIEEGDQNEDPIEQIDSRALDLAASGKPQLFLPSGKKYHVFFSYANPDMQWVKETVEKLEKEHGFVCCEYDRDNTPGTPLMLFAENSIRDAYKTVVVMTSEAFGSGFVNHEIDMVLIQGFDEKRKCIVPVLLKDCKVPVRLRALNYVDARDPIQRDIWWPKLLTELQTQGEKVFTCILI